MGIDERGDDQVHSLRGPHRPFAAGRWPARASGPWRRRRRRSCAGRGSRASARPDRSSARRRGSGPSRRGGSSTARTLVATDAPWAGGGASDVDGVEGVVLLGVAEAHGSDQRVRPEGRRGLQRGAARQVARAGQMPAGPQVVEKQAGAHVRALPPSVPEREQELHRPHEVRRQPRQQQPPLAQGLVHELELEHLEVAQPAVDQLARPAGCPGGEVDAPRSARPTGRATPRRARCRRR